MPRKGSLVNASEGCAAQPDRIAAWQRRTRSAIGFIVTLILLALIVRRIDVAQAANSLKAVSWGTLATALAMLVAGYCAKIARWYVMLASVAPGVGVGVSAQTLLASVALNNLLPLRAGDVARVFAFRNEIAAPASSLLPLMVLERLLDTAMLIVLAAAVASPMQQAGILPPNLWFIGYLSVAIITVMLCLAVVAGPLADRVRRGGAVVMGWCPASLRQPIVQALDVVAQQFRGRQAAALVVLTAMAWLFEGGMLATLAVGFGFNMPILAGYFACALATLVTLVPSAPGFFGTFHAAGIAAVSVFGAQSNPAAAFAFLAHILLWLPLTLGGLICLVRLSAFKFQSNSGNS